MLALRGRHVHLREWRMRISVAVDGVTYEDDVEPRTLLVQYLRYELGKTGTLIGCDTTNCGACTVLLNGLSDRRQAHLGLPRADRPARLNAPLEPRTLEG